MVKNLFPAQPGIINTLLAILIELIIFISPSLSLSSLAGLQTVEGVSYVCFLAPLTVGSIYFTNTLFPQIIPP